MVAYAKLKLTFYILGNTGTRSSISTKTGRGVDVSRWVMFGIFYYTGVSCSLNKYNRNCYIRFLCKAVKLITRELHPAILRKSHINIKLGCNWCWYNVNGNIVVPTEVTQWRTMLSRLPNRISRALGHSGECGYAIHRLSGKRGVRADAF